MSPAEFNQVIQDRIEKIQNSLQSKGDEYSRGNDRLHNFKRSMQIGGYRSQGEALKGMLVKHLTSVMDLIEDDAQGNPPTLELSTEKLGDIINYCIILEAIFDESRTKKQANR